MKKYLSVLLAICLIVTLVPFGTFGVNAQSNEVNVYDADAFKNYIQDENADIVLWQNISIDVNGKINILCNSIDLNGYTLSFPWSYTSINLASDGKTFSITDRTYNEADGTSTGKLKIGGSLNIGTSTLVIQSGVVNISDGISGSGNIEIYGGTISVNGKDGVDGDNGSNGADGKATYSSDGSDGSAGYWGESGTDGTHAIQASNLYVYGGNLTAIGGKGGNGGQGGNGGRGGDGKGSSGDGGRGGNGGGGGRAGTSGAGIIVTNDIIVYGGVLTVNGGRGGHGGRGGDGGNGGSTDDDYYNSNGVHGAGGNGGNGGANSHGSEGILAKTFTIYKGTVTAIGGYGGSVGIGGKGGYGGYGVSGGAMGSKGKFEGDGGAGINAEFTMYGGTVKATGSYGAAGIGGSGYTDELNGENVNVSGGNLVVSGGSSSFGIGGGYNGSKTGESGTLNVSGGVIEFCGSVPATNVSNPTYQNCTVKGEAANQHEGRYNADGKFTITTQMVVISSSECVVGETVTLYAVLDISRTSNISTPAPQGYISFKIDNEEIGKVKIARAEAGLGNIVANTTIEWVAVEGKHQITAGYVSGTGDMYAPRWDYELDVNITPHNYDNVCDTDCNICGAVREATHTYDNSCDKICNVCGEVRTITHTFSNACDPTCNICGDFRAVSHVYNGVCDNECDACGFIREAVEHTYDNNCDASCNVCGAIREISHIFDTSCDAVCNACGFTRIITHTYSNQCDPTCNICGEFRTTTHTYTNDCDAQCNICGFVREGYDHEYSSPCDAVCDKCDERRVITHTFTNNCDAYCNICSEYREPPHTFDNDYDATCNDCSFIREVAHQHVAGDWEVVTEATTDADGLKARKCECGEIMEEKVIPRVLTFASKTLGLKSNIALIFRVDPVYLTNHGYTNLSVVFNFNSKEYVVTDYTVNASGLYEYRFSDAGPHQMLDNVTAVIKAEFEGEVYTSEPLVYSIATYCTTQINALQSYSQMSKLVGLLVDMLNYGAAAQKFNNYNTSNLANASLTEKQLAFGNQDVLSYEDLKDMKYATVENSVATFDTVALAIKDSIAVSFKFTMAAGQSIDGLVVRFEAAGKSWDIPASEFTYESANNRYVATIREINPSQMKERILATIYKDGVIVSDTASYSIESYGASSAMGIASIKTLVEAMVRYGRSAKAYNG